MTLGDLKGAAIDRGFHFSMVLRFVSLPLAEIEAEVRDLDSRQLASLSLILEDSVDPQEGRTCFAEVVQGLVVEEVRRRFVIRQFTEGDIQEGGFDE